VRVSDFTSALYLGMRHPHNSLRPWVELTTGRPAAIESPRDGERLAQELARLLGQQRATLGTSTLHLFWDLFDVLATDRIAIYTDAGAYPIARWGVERVAAKGIPTTDFRSHDTAALEGLLDRDRRSEFRPVVVTDGLCPIDGRTAPLPEYLSLVRPRGGYLVIDDTQALGILGRHPAPTAPYGLGGAGSLAWHGIEGPELIVANSLAKGFGAPLAVMAGSAPVISKFKELSSTSVHSSPPSLAVIAAGQRALVINASQGDSLRSRLLKLVRRFRDRLRQLGLSASGGLFPVQTLKPIPDVEVGWLHNRLMSLGVKTVLHRPQNGLDIKLSFLITALHTAGEIDAAINGLQQAWAPTRRQSRSRDDTASRSSSARHIAM
jgi:8-amino-7-oxononanoate synthase